jgi:hypothetical protein
MADIRTKILYEEDIESLGNRYKFLKDVELSSSAFRNWHYTNTHKLGYKSIKALKIIFIPNPKVYNTIKKFHIKLVTLLWGYYKEYKIYCNTYFRFWYYWANRLWEILIDK